MTASHSSCFCKHQLCPLPMSIPIEHLVCVYLLCARRCKPAFSPATGWRTTTLIILSVSTATATSRHSEKLQLFDLQAITKASVSSSIEHVSHSMHDNLIPITPQLKARLQKAKYGVYNHSAVKEPVPLDKKIVCGRGQLL